MSKKELALVFEQLEKEHRFNGTILVSQDGEVLFEKAYGFASRQLNVPNVLETKFHSFLSRIRQYPEQKASIILLFNSDHINTETIFSAVEPLLVG